MKEELTVKEVLDNLENAIKSLKVHDAVIIASFF